MVLVLVRGPFSCHSQCFEVGGPFVWEGRQGPIGTLLPRQVAVTERGELVYEKAERSHEAPMQPVAEHLVEEYRREHRVMKGESG